MSLTKKTVEDFLDEIKDAVKEYLRKLETSFKQKLKKLLIISIITAVLVAAAMSFIGTASIFIIIGSLKYFIMFLPAWLAWIVMGLISIAIGAALLAIVFLIIRSQLKSSGKP